jgi:hypothetical protein
MNALHAALALLALVGVVCRCAYMQRTGSPPITWNVWAAAHASLGAGLVGVIIAAAHGCPLNPQTVYALLLGVCGLVLTQWRRRKEDR